MIRVFVVGLSLLTLSELTADITTTLGAIHIVEAESEALQIEPLGASKLPAIAYEDSFLPGLLAMQSDVSGSVFFTTVARSAFRFEGPGGLTIDRFDTEFHSATGGQSSSSERSRMRLTLERGQLYFDTTMGSSMSRLFVETVIGDLDTTSATAVITIAFEPRSPSLEMCIDCLSGRIVFRSVDGQKYTLQANQRLSAFGSRDEPYIEASNTPAVAITQLEAFQKSSEDYFRESFSLDQFQIAMNAVSRADTKSSARSADRGQSVHQPIALPRIPASSLTNPLQGRIVTEDDTVTNE